MAEWLIAPVLKFEFKILVFAISSHSLIIAHHGRIICHPAIKNDSWRNSGAAFTAFRNCRVKGKRDKISPA
jgi:hypothetical protein